MQKLLSHAHWFKRYTPYTLKLNFGFLDMLPQVFAYDLSRIIFRAMGDLSSKRDRVRTLGVTFLKTHFKISQLNMIPFLA